MKNSRSSDLLPMFYDCKYFFHRSVADLEYESSVAATSQLTNTIYNQQSFLVIDEEKQTETMSRVKNKKNEWYKELRFRTLSERSPVPQLARYLTWHQKRELRAG